MPKDQKPSKGNRDQFLTGLRLTKSELSQLEFIKEKSGLSWADLFVMFSEIIVGNYVIEKTGIDSVKVTDCRTEDHTEPDEKLYIRNKVRGGFNEV